MASPRFLPSRQASLFPTALPLYVVFYPRPPDVQRTMSQTPVQEQRAVTFPELNVM